MNRDLLPAVCACGGRHTSGPSLAVSSPAPRMLQYFADLLGSIRTPTKITLYDLWIVWRAWHGCDRKWHDFVWAMRWRTLAERKAVLRTFPAEKPGCVSLPGAVSEWAAPGNGWPDIVLWRSGVGPLHGRAAPARKGLGFDPRPYLQNLLRNSPKECREIQRCAYLYIYIYGAPPMCLHFSCLSCLEHMPLWVHEAQNVGKAINTP